MCGLAGFIPKNSRKPNIKKLIALGILNEDRGTDSCGIAVGDNVLKGTYAESKFRDFISGNFSKINLDVSKPVFIHTRKSTNGAHNSGNAHPFLWHYKDRPESNFVFMHNGVVHNDKELKYKFIPDGNDSLLTIDSHYLGLSLFFCKSFNEELEVLKSYRGKAAVAYYNRKDESVTIFKGGADNIEERPLYYVEAAEGYYFCSIDMSLELLFHKEVKALKNNQLLKFVKGKIVEDIIVPRTVPVYTIAKTETSKSTVATTHNNNSSNATKIIKDASGNYSDSVWPLLSLQTLLYKEGKDLVDGAFKIWGSHDSVNSTYALLPINFKGSIDRPSAYSTIHFYQGVACTNVNKLKNIYHVFKRKYGNTNRLVLESILKDLARDVIVDIIPLYTKNNVLVALIYKDRETGDVEYYDRNDFDSKTHVRLSLRFSSQKPYLVSGGSGIYRSLKLTHAT